MERKSKLAVHVMCESTEYLPRSFDINKYFLGKCEPRLCVLFDQQRFLAWNSPIMPFLPSLLLIVDS